MLGIDVNVQTAGGETALMAAVISEEPLETFDRLIEAGANPCVKNLMGYDAKDYITHYVGREFTSMILLEKLDEAIEEFKSKGKSDELLEES